MHTDIAAVAVQTKHSWCNQIKNNVLGNLINE